MAAASSLFLPLDLRIRRNVGHSVHFKSIMAIYCILGVLFWYIITFLLFLAQDAWSFHLPNRAHGTPHPGCRRFNVFVCRSQLKPGGTHEFAALKAAAKIISRSYNAFHGGPIVIQLTQAVGVIAFAAWGLKPLIQFGWLLFFHKGESSWKRSDVHHVVTSYVQPVLLWTGAILLCRSLEPMVLPSIASQLVKQRLLTFVRSLSTVLAFAYCLSSLIQQTQKFFAETKDSSDARNMGVEFAGKAVYTAVWVAAISLFMELLGFSTQKWLTAGGLGTVLITLAGREIFTNFLSSIMIHTTRPFVLNDWIQTKIEGYEVSGTVEHVGWWSPTVIRGDDREAVHIPNHKFSVNIIRNLSQKTHWRIKTHIAISHLDVKKISTIVADMRKVLAKNPQIEQQRLHRRIFLDNVHTESQALLIMVSCFVKTSHFEEYLCVKEAVVLDLLRVISHHRARLATPMRTVQKIYGDADVDAASFVETILSRATESTKRPVLLLEPQYKVDNDDKASNLAHPIQNNEGKNDIADATPSDTKVDPKANKDSSKVEAASSITAKVADKSTSDGTLTRVNTGDLDQRDYVTERSDKAVSMEHSSGQNVEETASKKLVTEKELPLKESSPGDKQDAAERHSPSTPKTILEENIVLGVALEGSKRMLQIEEETAPPTASPEGKNLAVASKDRQDENTQTPNAVPTGQRDTDR